MRLAILGSTGSIGGNTLDVVARHPERYAVWGLSAHRQVAVLAEQCRQFRPQVAVVAGPAEADALAGLLGNSVPGLQIAHGPQALVDLAAAPEVEGVMAAIVGAAGLPACLAAAKAGKRLMLANKEALVVGGQTFMDAVVQGGGTLLTVDSEHSAIFQCLPQNPADWDSAIDHIVLTASGGPFRSRPLAELDGVTPDEACAHPNWVMGRKISVDSATMMNKALEVIEARWLFHLPPERIQVLLHPQSVVHSMVVCRDESVLAQLGTPDMRVPIAYALSWPERTTSGASRLDFSRLGALTFEPMDEARFPAIRLAYDALNGAPGASVVLNAANEVAVEAFLNGRLRFTDIARVNAEAMQRVEQSTADGASLEARLALDQRTRRWAEAHCAQRSAS